MPVYNVPALITAMAPADIILVWQTAAGAVKTITYANFTSGLGGAGGSPGGLATQLQYNNAGTFGGIPSATYAAGVLSINAPVINAPTGIVKFDVGLGNVDNTADIDKPISTLTAAALALKAPVASPGFTGVPSAPTAAPGTNTTQLATTAFVTSAIASGGTVTTLSVVSANGFAGSVANPSTTPAITLTTTITGVLKGNGTAISAAAAGTDYVAPGAITTSGLTMATAKMLGRSTAGTGAIQEIATTGTGSAVLATAPTFPSTVAIQGLTTIDLGSANGALSTPIGGTVLQLGAANSASCGIMSESYGAQAFKISARQAGGTRASPSATLANAIMFNLAGFGFDTALTSTASGSFQMSAGSLWSVSNREVVMQFFGTPSGSTTSALWLSMTGGNISAPRGSYSTGDVTGAITGSVLFVGKTSGIFTMSVNDIAGTWTAKWPATAGSATNVLTTDGSGNLSWAAAGGGSGTVNSGTATQFAYYAASTAVVSSTPAMTVSATGRITISPTAVSSGVVPYLTISPSSDTLLTAGTEAIGMNVGNSGAIVRQHASNTTVALQREYAFFRQQYSFATGGGVISTGYTVWIEDGLSAGTNCSVTNNYALGIGAGKTMFGGNIDFGLNGANIGTGGTAGQIQITTTGGAGHSIVLTPEAAGNVQIAVSSPQLIVSDDTANKTWKGQANASTYGFYVQNAGGNSTEISQLAVAGGDVLLRGNMAGGTYGSLTATGNARNYYASLVTYGGSTWYGSGNWNISTTEVQSETSRGCQMTFTTIKNTTLTRNTVLKLTHDSMVLALMPLGGIGYGTGAGGAVTQATNRTTGVTLNTVSGAITLFNAAGTATVQSFTVTNSAVAALDTVVVSQTSGADLYEIFVTNVASGSFKITYFTTGGTTTEQPVFHFNVIRGVSS